MRTIALALIIGLSATTLYRDRPPRPAWHGPGWYQIAYSIAVGEKDPLKGSLNIIGGPFPSKQACEKTLPHNAIEPGLSTMEGDTRLEYWCDEEKQRPLWDHSGGPDR